jgi:hypothetical protein
MEQRFGVIPTAAEWLALVASIIDRKALLQSVAYDGMQSYLMPLRDVVIRIVWSPNEAAVVTVEDPATQPAGFRDRKRTGRITRELPVKLRTIRGRPTYAPGSEA